ncbi:MAG TPA: type II toxin-antitoxin system PemK/MazF family toxin [Ilumatobacter sp.]|nr:type II toxin-antitoxin system PemK/MazF family toxin [Ilumatobacter sp.]
MVAAEEGQRDGRRWFGRRGTETVDGSGLRRRGRRGLAPGGVVTIEYTPHIDGDPDPGEIVWAWVPFEEDSSQGKDRPVVIIGRRGEMLVGVPLTTHRDDREPQVEVGTGEWDSQHRSSYARIWRLFDVDPLAMRREGAIVTPETFVQIVKAVDKYYDVRIPRRRRRRDAALSPRT